VTAQLRDILFGLRAIALLPVRLRRCTDTQLAAAVDALNACIAIEGLGPDMRSAAEALYPQLRSRILSAPDIQAKAPLIEALHRYVYGRPGATPTQGPAATLAEARARAIAAYKHRPAMAAASYARILLHHAPTAASVAEVQSLLVRLAAAVDDDTASAIGRLEARLAARGIVAIDPADDTEWTALAARLLRDVRPDLLSDALLLRWLSVVRTLEHWPARPEAPYARLLAAIYRALRRRHGLSPDVDTALLRHDASRALSVRP